MFKKLKEKITEEVKSSPQRFQQLTQSVSDRLQNSSTSDENFFSIGEDDANTSIESGFTNVSLMSPQNRRNSSSSVASDVSFLPRYESVANMYHLQSDLEISASEIEDNASSSSQLGHLSKEQIYSAFQKAQMRYHKYRGRYTDLARHYKELERENSKMKSVLVETQDKAIRRVTELKEQCSLEQKAKAHLESALRDELDEKQFKIQSLQTKIELLQNGNNSDDNQEIDNLNSKIQELKANSIIFQTKEQEYKLKLASLEKEIAMFAEREKENNLTLAQNKMELHNELLSKDNELSNLKQENEALRKNLEVTTSGKLENLQTQNKKLIDKLEQLTQKCNTYENDLLKMEQYKIESQNTNQLNLELKNQLKEFEGKLESVREDAKKSLLSLESKVEEKVRREFEAKEEILRLDFEKKLEEISTSESSLKDLQLQLMGKEGEVVNLRQMNEKLLQELTLNADRYSELEKNHLELIEDCNKLRSQVGKLEKELGTAGNLNQASELKMTHLEENLARLEKHLESFKGIEEKLELVERQKEELTASLKANLEEETRKTFELLEEERRKTADYSAENSQLKEELTAREEKIRELETEKDSLLQELQFKENEVKKMQTDYQELREEFEKLKSENERVALLQSDLETSVQEKNQLCEKLAASEAQLKQILSELKETETEKGALLQKLHESESELEKAREENKKLLLKIQEQLQLRENSEALEKENFELKRVSEELKNLKETSDTINQEAVSLKETLKLKEDEIRILQKDLNEKETIRLEEMKISRNEITQYSEELNLLKKLLEEANNNLTIKEHEMENLLKKCSNHEEEVLKLIAITQQQENDFLSKFAEKDQQIATLSNKLEQYVNLIEERNEGFVKIFTDFPNQSTNNSKHKNNKNLRNLEEKLQSFEKTFLLEKENLSKVFDFLRNFESTYTSISSQLNQLETEKAENLKEITNLKNQIHEMNITRNAIKGLEDEIFRLKKENVELNEQLERLSQNLLEVESRNSHVVSDSNFLSEENNSLQIQLEELKLKNEEIQTRLNTVLSLESSSKLEFDRQITQLQNEKQLLSDEIDKLKANSNDEELENLRTKVIQYKSLDLTNRSSIEFYENELDKLKKQNEKLNRKLDETLVTLNHCSELSNSTEIEYLRNVLYNYMLGKESLVLARVIAAVCKFDPHQTETILAKEQQKQTLLGHLGIL